MRRIVPHVPAVREDRVLHVHHVDGAVPLVRPADRDAQDPIGLLLRVPLRLRTLVRDGRVLVEVEVPLLVALGRRVVHDCHGIDRHRLRSLGPYASSLRLSSFSQSLFHSIRDAQSLKVDFGFASAKCK
jgi:hypothetical protein